MCTRILVSVGWAWYIYPPWRLRALIEWVFFDDGGRQAVERPGDLAAQ